MSVDRDTLLDEGDKGSDGEIIAFRAQMNMLGAHVDANKIEEMLDGLIDDAEKRGFIFDWGFLDEMPLDKVVPDSDLDKLIRGVDDDEDTAE